MLEDLINRAKFTPSELREACVLACINYEMRNVRLNSIPPDVDKAFMVLEEFINKRQKKY